MPDKYTIGQMCTGRVVRIEQFGAFVELEPGIEALAHVSTFAPTGRADDWKARLPVGAVSVFEVVSVDAEKRRIGVALVQDPREAEEVREYTERADAAAPEAFGSLADKLRGALSSRQNK
jgi:small subunit ribosomal protein S1